MPSTIFLVDITMNALNRVSTYRHFRRDIKTRDFGEAALLTLKRIEVTSDALVTADDREDA